MLDCSIVGNGIGVRGKDFDMDYGYNSYWGSILDVDRKFDCIAN